MAGHGSFMFMLGVRSFWKIKKDEVVLMIVIFLIDA